MDRTEFFADLAVVSIECKLAWASVEIMTDDVASIQVLAMGEEEPVQTLRIACDDSRLRIEQPAFSFGKQLTSARWMQIVIRIPRNWRGLVDASTVSGALRVRNLAGTDMKLESVSGSIDADQLSAMTAKIHSVSGAIRVYGIQADAMYARNVSGELSIYHAELHSLRINCVSGRAEVQLDDIFDLLEANLVSSSLRVAAPMQAADATLHSVSGRLLTNGVSIRKEGPVISLTTVSGNVELIHQVGIPS